MSSIARKTIFTAIAFATTAGFLAPSFAADQAPAPIFVKPVPLVQEGRFPPGNGNEGIITVRYTVKADGTTENPEIVGGFTNPFYENLLKETIAKWTFTPGTVNGEAKDFLNQEYTFRIRVAEQLSISPDVAAAMDDINALISAKDFAKARDAIEAVLQNDVHSVFDYALMNQMMTAVYSGMADPFSAIVFIRKATMNTPNAAGATEHLLTPDILQSALKQHLMLASALRHQGEVIGTWSVIDDLYDIDANDQLHELVAAAEQQLASPDPLAALGKLVDDSWTHVPTRRIFTVADVREGELDKIIARCERRTLELEYQVDVDWNLPASVGDCKIEITGDKGTLFTLYEFSE